MDKEAFILFQ